MPVARPETTVAYLTTKIRGSQAEVLLTPAQDGVAKVGVVNLDSINTIPKDWLVQFICKLSAAKMAAVTAAIEFALDLK
jgi:mRNA-degrading endonuclease toxin of MazEF toxin-antitoxin module